MAFSELNKIDVLRSLREELSVPDCRTPACYVCSSPGASATGEN